MLILLGSALRELYVLFTSRSTRKAEAILAHFVSKTIITRKKNQKKTTF